MSIFFTENAQLLPRTYGIYSYKDGLYLGLLKNMLIVEISLVSKYNTFLQWILGDVIYHTFNTIYCLFDKTYSVI